MTPRVLFAWPMRPSSLWLALLAVIVACRPDRARPLVDSAGSGTPPASVAARSVRSQAASSDGIETRPGHGLPHTGSWTPTTTYEDDRFTITYPASATRQRTDSGAARVVLTISELPECKWPCTVTVTLWRDSTGQGLRGLLRERTTADTSGGNADAADFLPTIVDSIPLGQEPAVNLELYCGDCANHGIYTASGGWLAAVEYTMDASDSINSALFDRLEAVARSFRWRSP